MMVRSTNLGGERVLENKAKTIQVQAKEAAEIIKNSRSELFRIASLKSDTAGRFGRFLKLQLYLEPLEIFVFNNNRPIFWTSADYAIKAGERDSVSVETIGNNSLGIWRFKQGSIELIYVLALAKESPLSLTSQDSSASAYRENEFKISPNPIEHSVPVVSESLPLFHLLTTHQKPFWFWDVLFIVAMWMLVRGLNRCIQSRWSFVLVKLLVLGIYFVVLYAFLQGLTLGSVKAWDVFSGNLFSGSKQWNYNLGLLLVFSMVILFIAMNSKAAYVQFGFRSDKYYLKLISITLSAQASYWILFKLLEITQDVVVNGDINFQFHQFHRLDSFTAIGILILAVLFIAKFQFVDVAWAYLKTLKPWTLRNFSLLQIVLAAAWLFQDPVSESVVIPWIIFSLVWLFAEWFLFIRKSWLSIAMKVFLPCLMVSVLLQYYSSEKEQKTRKMLANEILLGGDYDALSQMARLEWLLTTDKGIVDYYTCLDETKDQFEKRLRELYFTPLSGAFDVQILDYNAFGRNYRSQNAYDYPLLNTLYQSNNCVPVTARFSRVNDLKLKGSYLGRFQVSDAENFLGVFFVILTPRISSAEGRLAQILGNDKLQKLYNDNQYSFGIYVNEKLSRSYGDFDYPVVLQYQDSGFFDDDKQKISHYILFDSNKNSIVLSRKYTGWLASMSGFTLMALAGIVLVLIYYLLLWLQHEFLRFTGTGHRQLRLLQGLKSRFPIPNSKDLFISSRLQLYVTWIVFATFVVVLLVTVNYFVQSYTRDQVNGLRDKTGKIAQMLTSKVNINAVFEQNYTALMYDLGDYYNTDINLYTAEGQLFASTNDQLIESKIKAPLMNPEVYAILQSRGSSAAVVNEQLGDLNYLSSYTALFDKDLNVKGYLNLPYFSNRRDLFREISDYTVTILNLFAVVFAIAILVAYLLAQRIALPLNIIRKQMSLVKIGERNQALQWDRNDEIGLLVREYNKMLDELDASLNRLAESERQGAWREMAKQVAHEIKNPLTPMRLSLQHLQYSIQRDDDNLKEKIQKTSDLLIRQIDALSEMAEEFSSFAKMPDPQLGLVNLTQTLRDSVALMGRENSVKPKILGELIDYTIWADANMLVRIFNNILKNAVQAIPDDREGAITVWLEEINDTDVSNFRWIAVNIKDNGKGIPDSLRERIFSPNFSTKNSGMGLGLAMVKKMVEQFGGEINYTTQVEVGTTFVVKFPIKSGSDS